MTLPDPVIEASNPNWMLGMVDLIGLVYLLFMIVAFYFILRDLTKR